MLRLLVILWSGLGLFGCTNFHDLEKISLRGNNFAEALAIEYRILAEDEADQNDWFDANHFATKGMRSLRGELVAPENPWDRKIPYEKALELEVKREALLTVLSGTMKKSYPQKAARSQALFDCWVEQVEEAFQLTDIVSCRESFKFAMYEIEAIKYAYDEEFTIQFALDSADVNRQQAKALGKIVHSLPNKPYHIHLEGHTDRSGSKAYNQRLSQSRNFSVKEKAVKYGVKPINITGQAFGESHPIVPTKDGVQEPKNRRVEIYFDVEPTL